MNNNGQRKQHVSGVVEENPKITDTSANFILKLKQYVTDSGAEFLLFVIPSKHRLINKSKKHDNKQFSEKWEQFSLQKGIQFLDLTEPFHQSSAAGYNLFYDIDIHFNENGHSVVALEIAKRYPKLFKIPTTNLK